LPANFAMPTLVPVDILLPEELDEEVQRRSVPGSVLRTFGRMKPGATVSEGIVGLQPFLEQSLHGAPPAFRKEIHLSVRSLRDRQVHDANLDLRVMTFPLGLAFVSVAIFGLAPALSNPAPEQLCGRDVRATTRRLLRQTLVAAQIAVSLVLLTCAGLLLRSLWNLQRA